MGILDEAEEPEPVNVLEYLAGFGLSATQAHQVLLHLIFTRTYVMPMEVREAAAELDIELPYVHHGDGRMH